MVAQRAIRIHARDRIIHGDALAVLRSLPDESVHCIVTSPPYWSLRDYGTPGQLGLEPTPEEYVARMVEVFREARRVLRNDGTLWLNLGDSYAGGGRGGQSPEKRSANWQPTYGNHGLTPAGLKPKDLVGIPWRVAFALQADGWWLRSDIIWHKPNCMPESVRDRPTKAHEYVFLLTKSERYYYDADAVREPQESAVRSKFYDPANMPDVKTPTWGIDGSQSLRYKGRAPRLLNPAGRNKRDVWRIASQPYKGAHFATFPPALVEPCVLAGCPVGGVVLDPFIGAGTVGVVARRHSRHYLGIELNADYVALAEARIEGEVCRP